VQNNRPTIYLATPIEGIWPKTWKCKKKKWCIHWLSIYLESTKNWSYLWQNNVSHESDHATEQGCHYLQYNPEDINKHSLRPRCLDAIFPHKNSECIGKIYAE
jgi:hypothetical protein